MKKLLYALLPLMVALFTFCSCTEDKVCDIVITYGFYTVDSSGNLQGMSTVTNAFDAQFDKSGMEKMGNHQYILRAQTSNKNAIDKAKKLAEAADETIGKSFWMNGKFIFEVRLYSGFGDDVAFSKNYGNQD